ncbi:transposase, partial [Micromonospora sp. NPDC023814]|uniref:transposase n=1 Tax=Micromonospora sp. NPDC023814 TaxID=3154596 RepID=UPI0033FD6818
MPAPPVPSKPSASPPSAADASSHCVPKKLHEALARNRAQQDSKDWQHTHALRAGVDGTISQAIAITSIRHARYRGLPKTRLRFIGFIRCRPLSRPAFAPGPTQLECAGLERYAVDQ